MYDGVYYLEYYKLISTDFKLSGLTTYILMIRVFDEGTYLVIPFVCRNVNSIIMWKDL